MSAAGSSPSADSITNTLMSLSQHVELASHKPGNVTLRISLSGLRDLTKLLKGVDLASHLESIPGLKSYKTSVLSMSATITYDPSTLPFDLWEGIFSSRKSLQTQQAALDRLKDIMEERS